MSGINDLFGGQTGIPGIFRDLAACFLVSKEVSHESFPDQLVSWSVEALIATLSSASER